MNDLTPSRGPLMSVKDIAAILGVTPEAIKKHIRDIYPDLLRNGVTTLLTPEQVTRIKERMMPTTEVVGAVTDFEMMERTLSVVQWMQTKLSHYEAVIEQQRPSVEYVQRYVAADGSLSFRKAAAVLRIPERQFIAELISRKFVYRTASDTGSLCAYSEHLRSGLFVEKTGTSEKGHVYTQTRITSHGMTYLARLFGGAA